jgi:ParB family chromosome partitioning protein
VEDYELIAGERRLRAAKMAGLSHVPVLIKEYDEVQSLEVAIVENVQRADINAVEAAYAYRKLIDEFGFSQQEVAKRVGKSQPSISNTLRLLDLPEMILEGLLAGEITEGHARPLLQVQQSNPQALTLFWQTLRQRKLSVREAEKMAREIRIQTENPPKVTLPFQGELRRDANLVAAEEALQTVLGTKVSIHRSGRGGKIEIEFYSEAELEGILERLMGRDAPE